MVISLPDFTAGRPNHLKKKSALRHVHHWIWGVTDYMGIAAMYNFVNLWVASPNLKIGILESSAVG